MKPSNNKAIYNTLCNAIEELQDSEKMSISKCESLVKLANAAMNVQMTEIHIVKTRMLLNEHNKTFDKLELRNVEGKAFDSIEI